jgi:hypothetical protein
MCAAVGKDRRMAAVELRSGKKKRVRGRMHIHLSMGISNNGALVGDKG